MQPSLKDYSEMTEGLARNGFTDQQSKALFPGDTFYLRGVRHWRAGDLRLNYLRLSAFSAH